MSIESLPTDSKLVYELYTGKIHKSLEIVVCLRCGRPLTNEKSRLAHLDPKCARKLVYEIRTCSISAETLQYHRSISQSSIQTDIILTKNISFYYNSCSSKKPFCRIRTVSLPAMNICTNDSRNYRKYTYFLPLLEGIIHEICICLPQVRVYLLQVQDQQLIDVSNSLC